jgi:hypothetical protein
MVTDILIPLIAGFGGTLLGIRHSDLSQKKEYKSLLLLLVQEYMLLLSRSTMYYKQFVDGPVSFSSLFQLSDNNTFLRLSQVSDNTDCIRVALELKADFFQVVRHVQRASEHMSKVIDEQVKGHKPLADEEFKKAKHAQSMAMNFFVGDQTIDGQFHRNRYEQYIDKIKVLLYELQILNAKKTYLQLYSRKRVLDIFVKDESIKLEQIREKIRLIREKEEILYNKSRSAQH